MPWWLLGGCGADRAAGGGATETGNGLQVALVTSAGLPASGAEAVLVRTDTWIQDVARDGAPRRIRLSADERGLVSLDSVPAGEWALQAGAGGELGWMPVRDRLDTLRMETRTLVQGTVSGAVSDQVWMVGTAWSSPVGIGGAYLLEKAAGAWALAGRSEGRLVPLGSGSASAGQVQVHDVVARTDRLVLDDFQDADAKTSLHRFTGLGNWYVVHDPASRVWSDAYSDRPDYQGALSLRYAKPDTGGFVVSGISFYNAAGHHDVDLSRLDSLCFEARATGTVEVAFKHMEAGVLARFVALPVPALDSVGWGRRCLRPASAPGWDSLRTRTNDISWHLWGGGRFDVRQIELWGPSLRDLSL